MHRRSVPQGALREEPSPGDVVGAIGPAVDDPYERMTRQAMAGTRPKGEDLTTPILSLITAAVADRPGIPFHALRRRLPVTDSELLVHTRRLEHAGVLVRLPGVKGPRYDVKDNPVAAVLAAGWVPSRADRIASAFADAWFDI